MSVEWKEDALDLLADIYVASSPAERDSIDRCVTRINARLAADPQTLGESRGSSNRVWFSPPLMVGYHLVPGGGVVVFHVARCKGDLDDD